MSLDWLIVGLAIYLVYCVVYYIRWLLTPERLKLRQPKYRRPRRHDWRDHGTR